MRDEAQTPEAEAAEEKPASKLLPLLVLIGALAIGCGAGLLLLGPRLFHSPAAAAVAEGHEQSESDGGHGAEPLELVALDNLVVNPANSGGTRFLLISLAFEPSTPEVAAALQGAEPQLRDAFVSLLGRRTIAELSDLALRDSIRAELLAVADSIVPGIRKLFIPLFVLQ
jgi:flagellar FliL protein